jgi:glycosyltransferase involved in cell wall biosynthesis
MLYEKTFADSCYQNKQIIAVGFGDPLSHKTFSGYSRHLFLAMREICKVAGYLSSQCLRISDICDGYVDFGPLRYLRKPTISSKWLWSPKTVQRFSQRFQEKLAQFDEKIPILQVGTHVYPHNTNRKFYCITDMTVKQAAPHKGYLAGRLESEEVLKAISVQRKLFHSYEKIFVLCDWTRKSVVNDYGCSPEKVITVGAGANMSPLEPAENKYGSHQILFVGYDWVNKGGPLLLEAFRIIKQKFPDASLNIVGCRPKISEDGVRVFGRLSKNKFSEMNELEKLYKIANCFCIMSEVDAFPNVLLEAQITQTPVVALDRGSRSEAVENGVTGILVKQSSAADVGAAIARIFSDRTTAQQMGHAGKKFVLERFTWPKVVEKILSHIFSQG